MASEADNTKPKGYVGDGVYVDFDGYAVWLKANNYDHPTDRICLEPEVWRNLVAWVAHQVPHMNDKKAEKYGLA
jgi:hypothetical protein